METADILDRAADLLERPGAWIQGDYTRGGDCFCALGAVCAAEGKQRAGDTVINEDESEACCALALAITGEPFPFMVARWNDKQGRTQAEVVSAIRMAASQARTPHKDYAS